MFSLNLVKYLSLVLLGILLFALVSVAEAIVNTGDPYTEAPIPGPITPNAGGCGASFDSYYCMNLTSYEDVFSNGRDLADPPRSGPCVVSTTPSCLALNTPIIVEWLTDVTDDLHTVPPPISLPFSPLWHRLDEALNDAINHELAKKLDTGFIDAALAAFGGSLGPTRQQFLGYLPEHGRWLKSTPDPFVMSNLRERGARLYCAAREAHLNHQNDDTRSMGKRWGAEFHLFGKWIGLLGVEPTIWIDGPLPYLGGTIRCPVEPCIEPTPNDGAQAFMVPFLFGTRITPVSLLRSLPEIRYPVVMVAGDSEVVTPAEGGSKLYHTVTHADAILSAEASGSGSRSVPLFYTTLDPLGLSYFQLNLNLGLAASIGELYGSDAPYAFSGPPENPGGPPTCRLDGPLPAQTNDRILKIPNGVSGWPPTRDGEFSGPFHDGKWTIRSEPEAPPIPYHVTVLSKDTEGRDLEDLRLTLYQNDPFVVRAFEDDDRHVWYDTKLGICAGLSGDFGENLPVIELTLTARGSIDSLVAQRHDLRDGALIYDEEATYPVSAVSVVPSMTSNAVLNLSAHLYMGIDLWFWNMTIFDLDIIKVTWPLADRPWDKSPEKNRFRLGTGSSTLDGDPMKQPYVLSHMPDMSLSISYFESFPPATPETPGNNVDTCLDPRTDPSLVSNRWNLGIHPALEPEDPCSEPPKTRLCVYVPVNSPTNVCGHIDAYVDGVPGLDEDEQACLIAKLKFLCEVRDDLEGVPLHQSILNDVGREENVMSRIFNPFDGECDGVPHSDSDSCVPSRQSNGLQEVVQGCVQDAVAETPPNECPSRDGNGNCVCEGAFCTHMDAYLKENPPFEFALCDTSGNLFNRKQLVDDHPRNPVIVHNVHTPPPATRGCEAMIDPFTFIDQTDVLLNSTVTSNSITVSGIIAPASISVTGGEYSINGDTFTSDSGTVDNGNSVQVRLIASSNYSTTTSATLTIGGVSDTFSVTTIGDCASCHGAKTLTMAMPDISCSDCHTAHDAASANASCLVCHTAPADNGGGVVLTSAQAAAYADNIHNSTPIARFSWSNDAATSYKINFNATAATCPDGYTCTYSWNFGDACSSNGGTTGVTAYCVYPDTNPRSVILTVAATNGQSDDETHSVTPANVNAAPTCGAGSVSYGADRRNVTFNQSGAGSLDGSDVLYINWGDGSPLTVTTPNSSTTHTYAAARQFTLKYMVKDGGGLSCKDSLTVDTRPAKYTITVNTSPALSGASVYIKTLAGLTRSYGTTSAGGSFVSSSLAPAQYKVYIYKTGKTFDCDSITAGNQMPVIVDISSGSQTVTCIYTP